MFNNQANNERKYFKGNAWYSIKQDNSDGDDE